MTINPVDNSLAAAIYSLGKINWDFPDRVSPSSIEGIHPYPAKFVAELPRALLNTLPIPSGTAVLDPFCGSGTTLVECQRRGLLSVGVDLNPIACLMTRVKTTYQLAGLKEAAEAVVDSARNVRATEIPEIPRLNHWFNVEVQNALATISNAIAAIPIVYQDALRMALSSIIVRVSNQESDTRYAAIEKNVTSEFVYKEFLNASRRISEVLDERDYPLVSSTIIEADTLTLDPAQIGNQIGLIITSPPYPNAYEYWLYHKYRMYWLGFDPISVKKREIGARAHFFKRDHHTADEFVKQMFQTFKLINEVLVSDGYVCFVIGRSCIHGRIVDNAAIIEKVARTAGFKLVFMSERIISAKRKSFNLSHAKIKTEKVLVLKRQGATCI